MIKIKQERKLINGCRTLNIKDDVYGKQCRKDVLRLTTQYGDDLYLDIEKDGTISIWSNSLELHVDNEV